MVSKLKDINRSDVRKPVSLSVFRLVLAQKPAMAAASIALAVLVLTIVLAPCLATHDPEKIILAGEYQKLPPSMANFFGTDTLGRDIWSRILIGGRVSLTVGGLTMLISLSLGTVYGAVAGYYGGSLDAVMMRLVDVLLSLPTIFLLIILAVFLKPGAAGIALIIGLTSWMRVSRLVRGQFLVLKEREFVTAARALGYSNLRIIFRHILPNLKSIIIVNATLMVANAIITESTLSFLGLGIQPPHFSWGTMLYNAQNLSLLKQAPWIAFFPGFFIFATVLSLHYCGDGLRDLWDTRLKNTAGGRD